MTSRARFPSSITLSTALALGLAFADAGSIRLPRGVLPGPTASYTDPLPDFGVGIDGAFVERGIEIRRAERNGPAAQAGLERGDIIREVNGQPILTPEDWIAAMTNGGGWFIFRLRDVRTGQLIFREIQTR